jgi:hypothetical protein
MSLSNLLRALVVTGFVLALGASAVRAAAPLGACCLPSGQCEDLVEMACEDEDGVFVSGGSACEEVDCDFVVTAPALSIVALAFATGVVALLGAYRLLLRGSRRAG